MTLRRAWIPATTRQLQLTLATLAVPYMLFIGGTFSATILFPLQRLNLVVGAGLALSWWLVRLVQRQPLKLTGLEVPLIVFAASQWLAVLTSTQPRLGLDWAAGVTTWSVALLILADCMVSGWPRSFWLNALVISAAFVAADGLWSTGQWFTSWATLGTLPPVTFRYNGLLGEANLTACAINLLWPVVLAKLVQTPRLPGRLALGGLLVGLAIAAFFTSSRAGWLAAGVAAALLAFMLGYARTGHAWLGAVRGAWQRWTAKARWAAIVGLVVVGLGGAWLLLKESQHATHGSLLESRAMFWSAAWDLFKSRPFLGVGPDLFAWNYSRFASIPPDFFAGHAHSVIFQILSGSGLIGIAALLYLGGTTAVRLWKQWRGAGSPVESVCLIAALVSFAVHGLFDFPVTPVTLLLAVILLALALSPTSPATPATSRGSLRPILAAPFVLLPIGLFALLLRSAASNEAALEMAGAGQWTEAAHVFEQTARVDPHMPLYWEEAAYAYTRAGDIARALPLWDQAAHDDPYWALLPATIGALRQDLAAAQTARSLAPRSDLYALNAGAIAEAQGDTAAAQEAYRAALSLRPALAHALYWQQSPLRQSVVSAWQGQLLAAPSELTKGQAALASNAPGQALALFQQAAAEDSNSPQAYVGLGQTYLLLGNLVAAQHSAQTGLALPFTSLEDMISLHLLAGDIDEARGNHPAALAEYSLTFDEIADYGVGGPGSYGYPARSWSVFHRQALPGELVPQLPRADITGEMDQHFAKLAQWLRADGQIGQACSVLARVYQEAPDSISGGLYKQGCAAASP